jgi:hypothetical protein
MGGIEDIDSIHEYDGNLSVIEGREFFSGRIKNLCGDATTRYLMDNMEYSLKQAFEFGTYEGEVFWYGGCAHDAMDTGQTVSHLNGKVSEFLAPYAAAAAGTNIEGVTKVLVGNEFLLFLQRMYIAGYEVGIKSAMKREISKS